jgi:23S rRNA (guanosine2251-2'-O)-methyltransferase
VEEIIAGKHAVLEALRSGRTVNKIWLAQGSAPHQLQAVVEEAKKLGVMYQFVDRRKLDQMVDKDIRHQGVVAQAAPYEYADLEDLFQAAKERGEAPFFVILDEIEDPHNLGSVIRTVECAGAHGVIIPKRRSAQVTAVVARTSAGAAAFVPVARVSNLAQAIDALKERGVWIAGADASAGQTAYEADLTGPLAIVIGSEGRGLSRLVREKCDFLVKLPLLGRIQSLNASVAAGILLYEAVRQRTARG